MWTAQMGGRVGQYQLSLTVTRPEEITVSGRTVYSDQWLLNLVSPVLMVAAGVLAPTMRTHLQ